MAGFAGSILEIGVDDRNQVDAARVELARNAAEGQGGVAVIAILVGHEDQGGAGSGGAGVGVEDEVDGGIAVLEPAAGHEIGRLPWQSPRRCRTGPPPCRMTGQCRPGCRQCRCQSRSDRNSRSRNPPRSGPCRYRTRNYPGTSVRCHGARLVHREDQVRCRLGQGAGTEGGSDENGRGLQDVEMRLNAIIILLECCTRSRQRQIDTSLRHLRRVTRSVYF